MTANSLNVRDFGAFGDGATDDTKAIQDAINYLLEHPNTNRQLYFPGGTYKITNSLFILKIVNTPPNQPHYDFVGLEICGGKPSSNLLGQGTILAPTFNDKPALVLQSVQGVTIKDIAIRGKNDYSQSLKASDNFKVLLDDSTFVVNGCRDNRYSPYAGICIDPYFPSVPDTERYPGQSSYYIISGGTSSSITIEGCLINGFVTGIVLAPNGATNHAAKVLIKDCTFEFNKVSVAICQASSDHVILQNIASFGNHFFVSTLDYGSKLGTAPFINGANVSATKYLFHMGTTYGLTSIISLYAKNTLSMGYISPSYSSVNMPATFVGCQFEFMDTHPAIDTHLWSFAPINFIGCVFSTNSRKSPLRFFNSNFFKFSSCFFLNHTVGGLDENDKNQTHYGEELSLGFSAPIGVKMENTIVRDLTFGSIIATLDSCYNSPKIAFLNGYSMPNGSQILADDLNATQLVTSSQIKEIHIGNVNLTADGLGNATFTVSNPGVLKRGDLLSYHALPFQDAGFVGEHYPGDYPYQNPGVIGQIAKIDGSTVTLEWVAKSVNSGTTDVSVKYIPRFHEETKGDVTECNEIINGEVRKCNGIIKNVSKASAWRKGDRISGDGIPKGAYITEIDFSQSFFVISVSAIKTTTQVRLYDADIYKFSGIPL
jgi:hypothetical protein